MASIANTATLQTNFNVAPYYDDFDESKNFHRILFRPGLGVQARELTQIQTILQNQIDRFAEHVFKEGSIVSGCELNYDNRYYYIKLRDKNYIHGNTVIVSSFLNKTITGANKNVKALVISTDDGAEANTPNFKTLFVKYTGGNTDGTKFIANGEVITASGGLTANVISVAGTGLGSAVTIGSGVIFAKDHFIRVDEQTLVLEKYATNPSYRVGFDVTETIVSETTDTTLLDPASGSYNYAAPGATRLKLTATLVKKPLTTDSANNFTEIFQVKNGVVQVLSDKPDYSNIKDYIAQRTYDESGNYVVRGFSPRIREHLLSGTNLGVFTTGEGGNSSLLSAHVEPGKAYVGGYDIEKIVSTQINFDKSTDYASIEQAAIYADYGNYVIVDNVSGRWDVNGQDQVTLRDTQANSISTSNYSTTSPAGVSIGTARVRAIEHYTGTPGLPSAQYKLYLTDINITTAGKGFANVQSIAFDASSADGRADIVGSNGKNANTSDPSFDYAVFKLPAKAIRRLRDTTGAVDNNFEFVKSFDISFSVTTGQGVVTTGSASETFTGSGTLSDAATRSRFYVVLQGAANTGTFTETLTTTSGSNTVTASATIDGKVNPGDIINIHTGGGNFVVSAVSGTTINLFGNASASGAGKSFHKRFKEGQVIDFGGVGKDGNRSINIDSTTQATLDMNEPLTTAVNATVITKLQKTDSQEATKTINRNRLIQVRVGAGGGTSYTANTTGPWPLGLSDGFKLVSVRKKSGSNFASTSEGTDVTSNFTLDTGMRDNMYDHARLVKKSTSTLSISSGDRLLVTLDYFTHSNRERGYFSVDSYPVNDATAGSDTTKIYTYQIPLFTSPVDGAAYDLRDCIDIRPRISDTANSVTSLTNISINPLTSTSLDEPSGGLRFIVPGETFETDLDYYLKRIDALCMEKNGTVRVIRGVSSLYPITPSVPDGTMHIATISLAPYPSLAPNVARDAGRGDLSCGILPVKNERFTMKDIGVIRDRIDRLEYYTSLSLLERDAKDLLIKDANGNDRFKNGILVDSMSGHNIGNVYDNDYKISIDAQKGEARPPFKLDSVELFYHAANSSNIVRTNVTNSGVSKDQTILISNSTIKFSNGETVTSGGSSGTLIYQVDNKLYIANASGNFSAAATVTGGTSSNVATISSVVTTTPGELITLGYTHQTLIEQPYASTTRNAAGLFWNYRGILTLTPDNDYWVDTTLRPDVNVNFDNNCDNWITLANAWGTQWNDWQTVVTGQNTTTKDIVTGQTVVGNQILENYQTEQTIEIISESTRTGTSLTAVPGTTTTTNLGSVVRDVNIIPFMRSKVIRFNATGMKPNTKLYAFFDDTNVSSYITPTNSSYANTANEGSSLNVDSSGNVYGLYRIPPSTFRTGNKKLKFTDNPTNSSELGTYITSAEAIYSAQGLNVGTSDTIVSTKNVSLSLTTVSETKTTTSTGFSIIGSGQNVVGTIPPPPPPPPITPVGPESPFEPPEPDDEDGGNPPNGDNNDGDGNDSEPISQSFLVNSLASLQIRGSGVFLTKIDLYFATKDSTLGITVEIREVDTATNFPTRRLVPFGRVTLMPSSVNTSDDASKPTPFIFPSPVYLQNDKEYCFTVIPNAINPNYQVWISRLGENDITTGTRISAQPAAGMLFASANDRTYVPVQTEDIKFKLYYASFDTSTRGTAVFKNENRDYLTVANVSSAFTKIGENVHGETLLVGTFAPGNGLKGNVATSNSFVQGMVSGATGIITSIGTNQIRVRNVSLTSKFRGKEAVRFRLGASATSSPIAGNSTGVITSATTPTGTVSYYDTVTASNTYLYVGNTSYINSGPAFSNNRMFTTGTFVRGQTDGYTARIVTINNLKADLINFNTDFLNPLDSRISFAGKFATSTSTRDTTFSQLNINEENKFSTSKYVLSRSIESNTSASSSTMAANKSFEIRSNMVSFSPISSPAIDVQRISAKIVENLINSNTDIGSSEDYVQFGGNAKARYITRKVTLADGQDAEDLKVYLTAYKPISAGVHVYFKVLHREDSDTFAQARWIPMDLATATTVVTDTENTESFKEYEYNIPVFSASSGSPYKFGSNTNNSSILEYRNTSKARFVGFKYFAIKVVLTDTASVNPPRFKDLRVIALQR